MVSTMHQRSRTATLLGVVLSLLFAAPAAAETLTVDPADANNACTRGADNTCKTVGQAVAAAVGGDTIAILKGTFAESVTLPADKDGLIVKGAGPETKLTGSGNGDVVGIAGDAVQVSDLAVEVPAGGASAFDVTGVNATITSVNVTRSAGNNEPAVLVTGSVTLDRSLVVNSSGNNAALRSTGTNVTLVDTVLVSTVGPGLVLLRGEANRLVRSTVASTQLESPAVLVESAADDATAKGLHLQSSVVIGAPVAVRAHAGGTSVVPNSQAGDVTIDIRHSTLLAALGLELAADDANGPVFPASNPAGNMTATVESSIVRDRIAVRRFSGLGASNTATVTANLVDTMGEHEDNSGTYTCTQCSDTPNDKLFQTGRVQLRQDAPVIDRGGPLAGSESDKDIQGEPRIVDGDGNGSAVSDIGADEFVNLKPRAGIRPARTTIPVNEATGFFSTSIDPEAAFGGGLKEYRWDFGDGTKATTNVAGVAHTYTKQGSYPTRVTVVDTLGVVSDPSPVVTVTVGPESDKAAPVVAITQPRSGQRLRLSPTRRPGTRKVAKPTQLTVVGTVSDVTGIKQVDIALRLVRRDGRRAVRCQWFNGRGFIKKRCDKPRWIKATRDKGTWRYRTPKGRRLPAGSYEVRVRGTDLLGNATTAFTKVAKTLVSFRIR